MTRNVIQLMSSNLRFAIKVEYSPRPAHILNPDFVFNLTQLIFLRFTIFSLELEGF